MEKLRILISAYACEPDKSSEQGVGWNWAYHLASHCQITVVTRANNRKSIEERCKTDPIAAGIQWIYHDLEGVSLRLKRMFHLHRLYYLAWQRSLIPLLQNLCANESFDIIHHLTFASYRYPTAVAKLPGIRIWGPVGGAERTPWKLLPFDHLPTLFHEAARNLQPNRSGGIREAKAFTKVLSSTLETQETLSLHGITSSLMPTIGIGKADHPSRSTRASGGKKLQLLFVGNLQYLKGVHFVLQSLPMTDGSVRLTIAGDGSYRQLLERLARNLGVEDRVSFLGAVSHHEVRTLYATHDVFVFPSLHDSGGIALLEAMAAGMPSIVLACGGPRIIADGSCGFQIPPRSKAYIVGRIAEAINTYSNDPSLRAIHGEAASKRIQDHFLWKKKAEDMLTVYRELSRQA